MSISLIITPIYASILVLILCILSLRVVGFRWGFKLAFGDGNYDVVMRAIRTHSNFTEFIPFALLSMIILELQGFTTYVHLVGILIIAGRIITSIALTGILPLRQLGMTLTVTGLSLAGVGMWLGPNGIEDQYKFIAYFGISLALSFLSIYVAFSEARAIKQEEKAKQSSSSK